MAYRLNLGSGMNLGSKSKWIFPMCGLLALAFSAGACGDDDGGSGPTDGGMLDGDTTDGQVRPDARVPDGGTPDSGNGEAGACDPFAVGANPGSPCTSGGDCLNEQACNATVNIADFAFDFTLASDGGVLPAEAAPTTAVILYPDDQARGECGDACDFEDPEACGPCGTCAPVALGGTYVGPLSCRASCTPNKANNGGCRPGYTCDPTFLACVEACASDDACRIGLEDANGDGEADFIYDQGSMATCDTTTGRCTTRGNDAAQPGDTCTADTDCVSDGLCLSGEAIPGGYCTSLFCDLEGWSCPSGAACHLRAFDGTAACLKGCKVGAEPVADRIGASGHGQGCGVGQSCNWDGVSGPDAAINGGCFPANYNDVRNPNLGGECQSDADCYSPFGLGRCIFATDTNLDSGLCAVFDCAQSDTIDGVLPGVDSDDPIVCGEGNVCVQTSAEGEPVSTLCLHTCTAAADCPAGYACNDLISSGRICWANCDDNADCRAGSTCQTAAGAECTATTTESCYCSDRMPRDGGVPETDAGVSDEDAGAADEDAGAADEDAGVEAEDAGVSA